MTIQHNNIPVHLPLHHPTYPLCPLNSPCSVPAMELCQIWAQWPLASACWVFSIVCVGPVGSPQWLATVAHETSSSNSSHSGALMQFQIHTAEGGVDDYFSPNCHLRASSLPVPAGRFRRQPRGQRVCKLGAAAGCVNEVASCQLRISHIMLLSVGPCSTSANSCPNPTC
jgi:hypothetical protein